MAATAPMTTGATRHQKPTFPYSKADMAQPAKCSRMRAVGAFSIAGAADAVSRYP